MTPTFEVGEIAIAVNDEAMTPEKIHLRYTGEECTVVAILKNQTMRIGDTWEIFPITYQVWFGGGNILTAAPHELRKKEPPMQAIPETDAEWAARKLSEVISAPLVEQTECV